MQQTAFAAWECVSLLGYGESFVLAPSDILSWTGPPLLPERGAGEHILAVAEETIRSF